MKDYELTEDEKKKLEKFILKRYEDADTLEKIPAPVMLAADANLPPLIPRKTITYMHVHHAIKRLGLVAGRNNGLNERKPPNYTNKKKKAKIRDSVVYHLQKIIDLIQNN